MAILDTVRTAARIKHLSLDNEINRLIAWSRSEMERAGVPHDIAVSETDPLIIDCIVQGCLKTISTDEKIREAAEKSFLYQLDCLRKHIWPEPNPEPEPDDDDNTPTPEPTPDTDPTPDDGEGNGDGT